MYISEPNGGSELELGAFVLNVELSVTSSEGRKKQPYLLKSHAPHECKSGIRLTTLPSFRAWTFSFSSSPEPVHRSGGVRFSVAQ